MPEPAAHVLFEIRVHEHADRLMAYRRAESRDATTAHDGLTPEHPAPVVARQP